MFPQLTSCQSLSAKSIASHHSRNNGASIVQVSGFRQAWKRFARCVPGTCRAYQFTCPLGGALFANPAPRCPHRLSDLDLNCSSCVRQSCSGSWVWCSETHELMRRLVHFPSPVNDRQAPSAPPLFWHVNKLDKTTSSIEFDTIDHWSMHKRRRTLHLKGTRWPFPV